MAAGQPGSEARQTFSFFFFVLSSLWPPAFVFADIVLAGVYFCSPPFSPVLSCMLRSQQTCFNPPRGDTPPFPFFFSNWLLPPELMSDRPAPNAYASVPFVQSTLKSGASFGTRLSAHYAREERRADGSDSGSSSSSSKDLVPLSCGRGVSRPGPALTAVL